MKNILIFRKHKNVLLRKGDHYFVVRFLKCWQGKMLTKKSFLLSPALIFWTDHIHNISLKNASKIQVLHQHQHRIFSVKNCLNWFVPHTNWLYDNRSLKIQRMSWILFANVQILKCKCTSAFMIEGWLSDTEWKWSVWYMQRFQIPFWPHQQVHSIASSLCNRQGYCRPATSRIKTWEKEMA